MRIAIVGGGALGSLFSARLARFADLVLITRTPDHARQLRETGIRVDAGPTSAVVPVRALPAPAPGEPVDAALILTKAYDTASACAALAPAVSPETIVVTLQNGLGNDRVIAAAFGAGSVVRGVTTEAATLLGPGHVRHAASGTTTLERAARPNRVHALAAVLDSAGFQVEVVADIAPVVWRKLAANAAINGPTALLGVPNGAIAEAAATLALALRIVDEVIDVAARLGVSLGAGAREAAVDVARATATNVSSMLQDIRAGRPTETEAIYGAVARLAREVGASAPTCETLALVLQAWAETHGTVIDESAARTPEMAALLEDQAWPSR